MPNSDRPFQRVFNLLASAAEEDDGEAILLFRRATADLDAVGLNWNTLLDVVVAPPSSPIEAKMDAGPIFEALGRQNLYSKQRTFVEGVFRHWLTKGTISAAQASSLASIASRYRLAVMADQIAGTAKAEWRKAYQDRRKAEQDRASAAAQAAKLREAGEWEQFFAVFEKFLDDAQPGLECRKAFQDECGSKTVMTNRVTEALKTLNLRGSVTESTVEQAFRGRGTRAVRLALAHLMKRQPSALWKGVPEEYRPYLMKLSYNNAPVAVPDWCKPRISQILGGYKDPPTEATRRADDAEWIQLHEPEPTASQDGQV